MNLCRELGCTLTYLKANTTYKELQLWLALRLIEHDERQIAELERENQQAMTANKGRFT